MKKLLMLIVIVAMSAAVYAQTEAMPLCVDPCPTTNCPVPGRLDPGTVPIPPDGTCFMPQGSVCYPWLCFCSPCAPIGHLDLWLPACMNLAIASMDDQSWIYQVGNSNQAVHDQTGDDTSFTQNRAFTKQYGDGNWAAIKQRGGKNVAAQCTWGDQNEACILQLANPNLDQWDYAFQFQKGNNNHAIIKQLDSFSKYGPSRTNFNNVAIQNQMGETWPCKGYDNLAYICQKNGRDNYALQIQKGDRNDALIIQTSSGLFRPTVENYAVQVQEGNDNKALTVQFDDFHWALTKQDGNNNEASIKQTNNLVDHREGNNQADVLQEGNNNFVGCVPDFSSSECQLYQNESYFIWGIYQWGEKNVAKVTQKNDCNVAFVRQWNIQNTAVIESNGYDVAVAVQNGNMNQSFTNQH